MTRLTRQGGGGYTLIEVLMVVTIIGLVGAIVVPQMLQAGTMNIQAASRMVIADIMYAQNDAVAQQAKRKVVFNISDNSYKLLNEKGKTLDVQWRTGGGTNYEVDFDEDNRFSGVTVESVAFGGENTNELIFDAQGAPVSDASVCSCVVLSFGEKKYEVKVTQFTGRVTVKKKTGG